MDERKFRGRSTMFEQQREEEDRARASAGSPMDNAAGMGAITSVSGLMSTIRTGSVRSIDGGTATIEPHNRRGEPTGPALRVRVPRDLWPYVAAAHARRDYACFTVDDGAVLAVIENLRL
jgi:hypothetical protein